MTFTALELSQVCGVHLAFATERKYLEAIQKEAL